MSVRYIFLFFICFLMSCASKELILEDNKKEFNRLPLYTKVSKTLNESLSDFNQLAILIKDSEFLYKNFHYLNDQLKVYKVNVSDSTLYIGRHSQAIKQLMAGHNIVSASYKNGVVMVMAGSQQSDKYNIVIDLLKPDDVSSADDFLSCDENYLKEGAKRDQYCLASLDNGWFLQYIWIDN